MIEEFDIVFFFLDVNIVNNLPPFEGGVSFRKFITTALGVQVVTTTTDAKPSLSALAKNKMTRYVVDHPEQLVAIAYQLNHLGVLPKEFPPKKINSMIREKWNSSDSIQDFAKGVVPHVLLESTKPHVPWLLHRCQRYGIEPKDFRGLLQFLKPKLQEEREQLHTLYNQLHEKSPTLPQRLLNILKHRGRRSPTVIITPSEFREISKKAFFTISMKIAEGIRRELFPPKKKAVEEKKMIF